LVLALCSDGDADAKDLPERLLTHSRSPYVHRVTLYDETGEAVSPEDFELRPWSPSATCGKCHPYETVGGGWHFNAGNAQVDPGRPGEPWILTDLVTGTQLPLSRRGWPGTYKPEQVGVTPWEMVQRFGRHLPGGGVGEPGAEEFAGPEARWQLSGPMEIDCLACHSLDRRYDHVARARQIEQQNLKWIPTVTSGIGTVRGAAKNLPADYDPLFNPDASQFGGPSIEYDDALFDANERVFFDISRRMSPERCYFCHTTRHAGDRAPERWEIDRDVHLAAGMICVDCHRNGLDHAIVRGYEGEPSSGDTPSSVHTLSCRGCHYGVDSDSGTRQSESVRGGRLGAPQADHPGLPPVHFEKLSCTTCHGGPLPTGRTRSVETSMAHGLGLASRHRGEELPPFIEEPVFLRDEDGVYTPHRILWPAFWGRLGEGAIQPIAPESVRHSAGEVLGGRARANPGQWQPLTEDEIAQTLKMLGQQGDDASEPVYVHGGAVYELDGNGEQLIARDHPQAAPYAWPFAHDVRPAARSLGAGGCAECHGDGSPFHFARVAIRGPAALGDAEGRPMHELQGKDAAELRAWAWSFRFRGWLKWTGFAASGVVGLVLLVYLLQGVGRVLRALGREE